MKKTVRGLTLILCVCLLTLSLCSCKALDKMRANRAIWEGKDIRIGNVVYQKLPACDGFSPAVSDCETVIAVTEKDLPLLLSGISQDTFYRSDDGAFLQSAAEGERVFYCRSDKYADITARMKAKKDYTVFAYQYEIFDENAMDTGYMSYEENCLTEKQTAILKEAVLAGAVTDMDPAILDDYFITVLYAFTADKLFCTYVGDIFHTDKGYYLSQTDENAKTVIVAIPEQYATTLDEITLPARQAEIQESGDGEDNGADL